MLRILSFLFASFISSISLSQSWDFQKENDLVKSVVKIDILNASGESIGHGTGVVIKKKEDYSKDPEKYYLGYILTAAHVLTDQHNVSVPSGRLKFTFYSGDSTKNGSVTKIHPKFLENNLVDVGIAYGLIPKEVTPLEVSNEDLNTEDEVEFIGYGGGDFRHFKAKFAGAELDGRQLFFTWAVQGDSGGPILKNGKVVGVIYGGEIWIKEKYLSAIGATARITAPTKSASLKEIRELVKSVQ
jgi:hypothetical protein